MTRVGVLRVAYAFLGVAFLSLAGSVVAGGLLFVGFFAALVGAALLLFTDDDLPKWAGVALVTYFTATLVAFLAATPITVRRGGNFGIEPINPELTSAVAEYLVLLSPLMFAATALASAWEREQPPRLLMMGAVGGFVLVAVLTVVLTADDATRAMTQGNLLRGLFAVSAAAGAVGSGWAAARPDEYG